MLLCKLQKVQNVVAHPTLLLCFTDPPFPSGLELKVLFVIYKAFSPTDSTNLIKSGRRSHWVENVIQWDPKSVLFLSQHLSLGTPYCPRLDQPKPAVWLCWTFGKHLRAVCFSGPMYPESSWAYISWCHCFFGSYFIFFDLFVVFFKIFVSYPDFCLASLMTIYINLNKYVLLSTLPNSVQYINAYLNNISLTLSSSLESFLFSSVSRIFSRSYLCLNSVSNSSLSFWLW